jgi:DNA (cytosine-5)-methyltransferase 1
MRMMILNDQGGSVMDVSEDVTACLRAQDHGHPPVICFEPGIVKREGSNSRFVMNKCGTLRADMGDNKPAVCMMKENNVKCLNPWDPQSKRQYQIDGVYATLHARQKGGGQTDGICYAIEGNVVDRVSAKNGKGWCEDVSPTLNTQDRHAVVYALEGNGARPSHMGKGWSTDGTMYTLNTIEQHSVCYGISRSCLKGGEGSNGGMPVGENVQPSLTANGCGAVCYAVENHPCDSRVRLTNDGIVQTLNARMRTGGGNVPLVLEVLE